MKRRLFLSFTGLMMRLASGHFGGEDLETALFYFGCSRGRFDRDWSVDEETNMYFETADEARHMWDQMREALLLAEREERAMFRSLSGSNTYQQLSELLVKNGLPELDSVQREEFYSGPNAHHAVTRSHAELEVVYR